MKKLVWGERAGGDIEKVLHLPARRRFGEGRAVPFQDDDWAIKNFNQSVVLQGPVSSLFIA